MKDERDVKDNLKVKEEREAVIESLRGKLKEGAKALIGNRGYRRYFKADEEG